MEINEAFQKSYSMYSEEDILEAQEYVVVFAQAHLPFGLVALPKSEIIQLNIN